MIEKPNPLRTRNDVSQRYRSRISPRLFADSLRERSDPALDLSPKEFGEYLANRASELIAADPKLTKS